MQACGEKVEKYCGDCSGKGVKNAPKTISITVPCGVEDGNRLRVRNEGDAGPKGRRCFGCQKEDTKSFARAIKIERLKTSGVIFKRRTFF